MGEGGEEGEWGREEMRESEEERGEEGWCVCAATFATFTNMYVHRTQAS